MTGHPADSSQQPTLDAPRAPASPVFVAYKGPSMNPTLREPEVMEIVPYGDRPAKPGDVILFVRQGSDQPVVHRVTRRTADGIGTRGDNNLHDDGYVLQPSEISGRVVAAWRGERRRKIAGGRTGCWVRRWLRWRQGMDLSISRLLHPLYYALARWGIVRRLAPASLRPRVVAFRRGRRSRLQLLFGRRTVGWYDVDGQRWRIQRPYRLLVDEPSLPTAAREDAALCDEKGVGARSRAPDSGRDDGRARGAGVA
jgi:hypothetical protein